MSFGGMASESLTSRFIGERGYLRLEPVLCCERAGYLRLEPVLCCERALLGPLRMSVWVRVWVCG